jgi:phage terminase small subunit
MPRDTLTPKQERFVQEYLKDSNATQAAIRAGYSVRTAESQGSRLLRNVKVFSAVQIGKDRLARGAQVSAERVLSEMSTAAFADIGQVLDFSGPEPKLRPANEIPEHARRAIASMKVKRHMEGTGDYAREVEVTEFKLWDKLSALDKLCRHLGLYAAQEVKGTLLIQTVVGIDEGAALGAGPATPAV